jgi:hypothetical protein
LYNNNTYKWKVHNGKIEIIYFAVSFRSYPPLFVHCEVGLCLVDVFFNIQSIYLWVQTVLLLFLYSYEADFIQGLLKKSEKKLARYFNFTFRYIDDVLSLNNSFLSGPFCPLRGRSRYEADLAVSVVSFISSSMG